MNLHELSAKTGHIARQLLTRLDLSSFVSEITDQISFVLKIELQNTNGFHKDYIWEAVSAVNVEPLESLKDQPDMLDWI